MSASAAAASDGSSFAASIESTLKATGTVIVDNKPAQMSETSKYVEDFVRRAWLPKRQESLKNEDVVWSRQASAEVGQQGARNLSDVPKCADLAFGGLLAFVIFAYIGCTSYGNASSSAGVLVTSTACSSHQSAGASTVPRELLLAQSDVHVRTHAPILEYACRSVLRIKDTPNSTVTTQLEQKREPA